MNNELKASGERKISIASAAHFLCHILHLLKSSMLLQPVTELAELKRQRKGKEVLKVCYG
jgi:hypothetical protein